MVKYLLKVKAELENIESFRMPQSWQLTVQQSAGDERKGPIFVSTDEEHEISGSRGTANFVLKWPGTKNQSYMNIVQDKAVKDCISGDDQDFVPVVCFECRGIDPVEWHTGPGFSFKALESGTEFTDIDLTGGDWYDYDEAGAQSVGLSSIEYRFERC
mmetsp:Transcript_683/g.829  ORF Transcript_683/g.829 Transcript_683/m.829 type:complete len:158 (+) Transcript_683:170-643(+)